MPRKILIVKSESYLSSQFEDIVSDGKDTFHFTFVENRKEANEELKKNSFDQIVTALKIPRISDGFLLLNQIVNKKFTSKDIIVVVDEKTDNVISSLNSTGIVNIYSANNLDDIVADFFVTTTNKPSLPSININGNLKDINDSIEKIQTVLNYVMGPVGNIIFKDVVQRWQNQTDVHELLNLIKNEIGDEGKISLFQDRFNELGIGE